MAQLRGERMSNYQVAWILFLMSSAIILYFIHLDNVKNTYYWRGRKHGWDMHRRMIDNKRKTDEVFDYEKN